MVAAITAVYGTVPATAAAQQITGTQPNMTITVEGSQLPAPPPKFGGVINETAVNPSRGGRRAWCHRKARPTCS